MKIVFQDLKKGEVKVEINSLDDIWFISHLIDEGDDVSGRTIRKLKLGEGTDRNIKIVKKQVTLKIHVEKVEFHKYTNVLRVSGKITEGPEDISRGSYHTFDVEEGTVIKIHKKQWLKYQLEKLKEATAEQTTNVLIVTIDREDSSYALLRPSGYKMLSDFSGEVEKKGYADTEGKQFYSQVTKHIVDYVERYGIENIILASPAFWKEDLMKEIKKKHSSLIPKITLATCSSIGQTGVEEVLKRDEVKTVLKKDRTAKEESLVEELFKEISKQGKAAYGLVEVKEASDANAIDKLLITDDLIQEQREAGNYEELDNIMKAVDRSKGDVKIISTDHDAGKKLHGLGGIGAILRYKLK